MAQLTLLARSLVCCLSQARSAMATLARKRTVQRSNAALDSSSLAECDATQVTFAVFV